MDPSIEIRKAEVSDVPRLSVLYRTVYIDTYALDGVTTEFTDFMAEKFSHERLTKTITQYPDLTLVATYNGNLVGVAEIELERPCPIGDLVAPELAKLYLLNKFKGRGIGKGLLIEVESYLRSKGHPELWVWAYAMNLYALKFYAKNGYRDIGKAMFRMTENEYENRVLVKQLN